MEKIAVIIDTNVFGDPEKYDFENIKVEVINTKGYEGQYTLTALIDD